MEEDALQHGLRVTLVLQKEALHLCWAKLVLRHTRRELDRKVYETTGNVAALADMDEEDTREQQKA